MDIPLYFSYVVFSYVSMFRLVLLKFFPGSYSVPCAPDRFSQIVYINSFGTENTYPEPPSSAGHQWLRQHVGVTPETGLCFGLPGSGCSSSWAYLLSQAGVKQTIVTVSGC